LKNLRLTATIRSEIRGQDECSYSAQREQDRSRQNRPFRRYGATTSGGGFTSEAPAKEV